MAEPTSTQIAAEIQKIVQHAYAQDPSQITVNNVRKTTTENLDLPEAFFQSGDWKLKSRELVKQYMEELTSKGEESEDKEEKSARPVATTGKKRASSGKASAASRKSQKTESSSTGPAKKSKAQEAKSDIESEMSDVQDEPPKPKRSRKGTALSKDPKQPTPSAKAKPVTKSKSSAVKSKAAPADLAPDEAEIKRLQSYLLKCGIRKIWGVFLKPYGDNHAKIKCLKDMLREAGMTGRFSNERAAQIKEARELADEVEAVNEGAEKWGRGGGRKKLSRGKAGAKQRTRGRDDDDDDDDEHADEVAKDSGSSGEAAAARDQADPRKDLAFIGDEESD